MIWSILRIVIAASEASLIAHSLVCLWSYTFSYLLELTSPETMSRPLGLESSLLAAIMLATNSLELMPEFSARMRGKTSKDFAKRL